MRWHLDILPHLKTINDQEIGLLDFDPDQAPLSRTLVDFLPMQY